MLPIHPVRAKSENYPARICPVHRHTTQKIRQIKRRCRNFIIHFSRHRIRITSMVCVGVVLWTICSLQIYSSKGLHRRIDFNIWLLIILQPNNWAKRRWLKRQSKCHDWNLCNRKHFNLANIQKSTAFICLYAFAIHIQFAKWQRDISEVSWLNQWSK